MNQRTQLQRLIKAKHDHIRAIDRIEAQIAELTQSRKYSKYRANNEQVRLE